MKKRFFTLTELITAIVALLLFLATITAVGFLVYIVLHFILKAW